ncbi:hypothetical protein NW754_001333 [Fusarium falciforme]|uniref:Chromo domain-containing protein n=1 Tax=Fusarium falciforme TaxID=195108 RepID=A0A9W8UU20_9HYPO|nr:hypothetical protein NW754_001333 [Fusarium falciforme]KAJ4175889.1 hypothetical protein NW755_014704 [Fusarium falciforme]KAJ4176675.1 hypothetical protein NW767_015362 [Fusarium falciforme]KAJ4221413.1 hypothetical protein NW757_014471 [Fusarium falciforme]
MATGTPTKQGEVSTVCDKNVNNCKLSSDAGIGTRKGLRRSLRGTPNIGNPAKDNVDRLTPGAAEPNEPKSINEQRGKKDAEANGVVPTASGSVGKPFAELEDTNGVDELVEHSVNEESSTVEFKVKCKESGETTWEAERDLQEDVPTLVYKYWDGLGGRETATGLDHYHVFKILKSAKVSKSAQPTDNSKDSQYRYQVQWVGYPRTDSTWERESTLREIALDEFEKFEAKELERGAVKSQKRKNVRGPGRPRKKARGANN